MAEERQIGSLEIIHWREQELIRYGNEGRGKGESEADRELKPIISKYYIVTEPNFSVDNSRVWNITTHNI